MTSGAPHSVPPVRTYPAHYGAAVLAACGVAAVQFVWPTILSRPPAVSWWPLDACVLLATTCFLATTAWMHVNAARWLPWELAPRLSRLRWALVADVAVGLLAAAIFIRGPETAVLHAGLWLLAPLLLTAGAASAIVGALALRDGSQRLAAEAPPAGAPAGGLPGDLVRIVLAILLLAALAALEWFEPKVKPWEPGVTSEVPSTRH